MDRNADTARHPGRQVSRLAHLIATQKNNRYMTDITPESIQPNLDAYRAQRDSDSSNMYRSSFDVESAQKNISASFKNRHNKDYKFGDG